MVMIPLREYVPFHRDIEELRTHHIEEYSSNMYRDNPNTPPIYNKKPSVKKLQGSKRQFLNFLARAQGGAGGPTAQEKTEGDRILLFHCLSSPQVFFFGANIYQNAGTIFCSVLLLSLAYAICKFPVKLTSIAFSNLRNWCPMSTHSAVFRIPFLKQKCEDQKVC